MPAGGNIYIRGTTYARTRCTHTRTRAKKGKNMAATYDANMKILEQKLKAAGLYNTGLRPAMKECANIMARIHHYNEQHIAAEYRTQMPDGKRPPELMALENASRELLNYLKALGLVADTRKQKQPETKKTSAPQDSPMAALAQLLASNGTDDDS